jgi:hypothetical protein
MNKGTITRKRNMLDKLADAINTRNYSDIPNIINKASLTVIIDSLKSDALENDMEAIPILFDMALTIRHNIGRPFTMSECKEYYGLSFTLNHNAKMSGMVSISTDNKLNPYCKAYKKCPDNICHNCFADEQLDRQPSQEIPYIFNTFLLTHYIIPVELLPIINNLYFRFESFGDLINSKQFTNYCNICVVNPMVHFSDYTKNLFIIDNTFRGGIKKPGNLKIVASSIRKNEIRKLTEYQKTYVDHVFTVYSLEYLKTHTVKINCGARHCLSCLNCYIDNTDFYISEIEK